MKVSFPMDNPTHRPDEHDNAVVKIDLPIARKVLETVDAGLSSGVGVRKPGEMCVEAAVCYALDLPHGDDPGCVSPALRSLKIRLNDSKWSSKMARAKGLRRLALIQLGSKGHLDDREFAKRVAKLAIQTCVPLALRSAASIHKDAKHKAALIETANRCEKEGTRQAAIEARSAADAANAPAAYADAAAAAYADADVAAAAYADVAAYAVYAAAAAADADAAADAANAPAAYADAAAVYAAAAAVYAAADDAYAAKSARDKALADFAEGVVQILIEMDVPGKQWLHLTEAA